MTTKLAVRVACVCGLWLCGCPSDNASGAATADDGGVAAVDFVAEASDFECLSNWTKVRGFYLTNKLGKLEDALAVADASDGGQYPVGTIIQLIPTEAMVKRADGFSAETGNWEFFSLSVSGGETTILDRGTTEVVNQFNGNCMNCHEQADAKFDFVCEEDHGCTSLPIGPALIDSIQKADPRCK